METKQESSKMATIKILGDIGASVEAEDIINQITAVEDDKIKVLIASPGGSAFQGLMIYDALKASNKEITTVILGLGASAASVIFMAGNKREMGEGALLMVHNSRVGFEGTAAQMREQLETLDAIDDRMKSVLMGASGISDEDATALLSKDSFMNLETAMSLGLATDSIQDDIAASLNINNTKKEPVKMAIKEEEEKAGFFKHMALFFKSEAKEDKPEDEEKAMEDEEKPEDEKSKSEDIEKKEEAKAEGNEEKATEDSEEDKEKEEMKATIASLQAQLADANEKSQTKEEEEALALKAETILAGITDKKITMHQAKNLFKEPIAEVSKFMSDLSVNATGRGKTPEPKDDPNESKLDQWKALKAKDSGLAQKFYNQNVKEIRSEMNKEN